MTDYWSLITDHWRRLLLIVALVAVVVFFAIRALGSEQDAAWERVQATGAIVFATDATYPPFEALNIEGEYWGFDVDLAREVAARLGVRAEFDLTSYDALIGSLLVGRADAAISALVEQPHRLHEAHFTRPYFNAGTVLVQPAAQAAPGDALRWAANRSLAVENGSQGDVIARRWSRRIEGLRTAGYSSARDALLAVAAGQADGALVDATAAFEFAASGNAVQPAMPVEDVPYVIAVSAESPRLRRELDQILAEMEADGSLGALRAEWLGEAARELRFTAAAR